MEPAIRSRGRFHKTHRRTARGLPTPSPHCPTLGVLPDSLQVLYHSELHRPNGQMNLVYKRGMVAIRGFDWLTPSVLKASRPHWPERRGEKPRMAARPLSAGVVRGRVAQNCPASSRVTSYLLQLPKPEAIQPPRAYGNRV